MEIHDNSVPLVEHSIKDSQKSMYHQESIDYVQFLQENCIIGDEETRLLKRFIR